MHPHQSERQQQAEHELGGAVQHEGVVVLVQGPGDAALQQLDGDTQHHHCRAQRGA